MELPVIDLLPVHQLTLPILKQKVKYRPFTVEQEKGIITANESDKLSDTLNNFMALVKQCLVDTEIDFDKLSAMEFIYISICLRAKSKGESLSLVKTCSECEKKFNINVNLDEAIVFLNEDNTSEIAKISDELQFEVVPLKLNYLHIMDTLETKQDVYLQTALYSISKVIYNDNIYDQFTPEEIAKKIPLVETAIAKIFEATQDLIRMKLIFKSTCTHCKHEEENEISDFLKLLN